MRTPSRRTGLVVMLATALVAAAATPASAAAPHAGQTITAEPAQRQQPVAPVPPADPRVYVQGDSLTVGTLAYGSPSYLRSAWAAAGLTLSPSPSAKVGRKVAEGLAILEATGPIHGTVVIALGTNDFGASPTTAAAWVSSARSILGPGTTFFWVNLRMTGSRFANQARVNAGLLQGVREDTAHQLARHGAGRAFVLDWSTFAADHHVDNRPDGIHYSMGNYQIRARFYAQSAAGDPDYLRYRLS
jgi:hypothetical protein